MIETEYSVTEWADEVEVRVQLSCTDPCFSLATRVFSQRSATFALACVVDHVVVGDQKPSEPKKKKKEIGNRARLVAGAGSRNETAPLS